MSAKLWWVYLLSCQGGRTYAGVAVDVAARFALHQQGKAAKFTRANPPLEILGVESFATRSEALKAEYALKQLERVQKLKWAGQRRWTPVVSEEAATSVVTPAKAGIQGATRVR